MDTVFPIFGAVLLLLQALVFFVLMEPQSSPFHNLATRLVDSLLWISVHVWHWRVVWPLFVLCLGAGITAMYSNAYIAAVCFYFVGIAFLAAKCLSTNETRSHENKALISLLIVVLAVVLLAASMWATRQEYLVKIPAPAPTTPIAMKVNPSLPTATPQPAPIPGAPPIHHQKPSGRPTPLIAAADPYAGIEDKRVSKWATDEADRIEQMGKKCGEDMIEAEKRKRQGISPRFPDALGPQGVQAHFLQEFENCCKLAITKLHDSLALRLGPPALNALEEEDYKHIVDFPWRTPDAWPLCMDVQGYARDLRIMAAQLKETNVGK